MSSPATAGWRHLRAAVVAATVVALSAAGHVLGGGHRPHPVALLLLTAVAMVPAYVGGRVQLRYGTLVALLGIGQVVVHHVLAGAGSPTPSTHHVHEAATTASAAASPGTDTMLAGHALATLVVAALLAHGDAVLWRVWRWLCSTLAVRRPVVVPAFDRLPRLVSTDPFALCRSADVRRTSPPRAPPPTAARFAG